MNGEPSHGEGLRFLSRDEYLREFGWRGRVHNVRRSLKARELKIAWRELWYRPKRG